MSWARMAVAAIAILAAGALLISGGSRADPKTPPALPGLPPPFLGVAVLGQGELTAAVDAYGNVVDLRPSPAGEPLIENSSERQAAGTVPADTGIQVWVRAEGSMRPLWRADFVRQSYLPRTNALKTVARFGPKRIEIRQGIRKQTLEMAVMGGNGGVQLRVNAEVKCREHQHGRMVRTAVCSTTVPSEALARVPKTLSRAVFNDRRWLSRRRPLGPTAPRWAERMYERSLLVLRALTDRRNGAVAAGARDGWAYVWPRDAGAAAIALAAAGYRPEAGLVTQFLLGAGIEQAARFHGDGSPVPGRDAQGDEVGWTAAAAQAAGVIGSAEHAARILTQTYPVPWRDRADYWEGEPGDYLANAIASGESAARIEAEFGTPDGLAREAGGGGGLESAAAWAVRPFPRPSLFEPARRTLLRLAETAHPYGLLPGEGWKGGEDPWTAPTAWSAWSLAALGERERSLRLMAALRRSATPPGDLPERVDARTGIPRSTTPLAWTHAFSVLALHELWPSAHG